LHEVTAIPRRPRELRVRNCLRDFDIAPLMRILTGGSPVPRIEGFVGRCDANLDASLGGTIYASNRRITLCHESKGAPYLPTLFVGEMWETRTSMFSLGKTAISPEVKQA
jgi:hypothetical protein